MVQRLLVRFQTANDIDALLKRLHLLPALSNQPFQCVQQVPRRRVLLVDDRIPGIARNTAIPAHLAQCHVLALLDCSGAKRHLPNELIVVVHAFIRIVRLHQADQPVTAPAGNLEVWLSNPDANAPDCCVPRSLLFDLLGRAVHERTVAVLDIVEALQSFCARGDIRLPLRLDVRHGLLQALPPLSPVLRQICHLIFQLFIVNIELPHIVFPS